MLKRKPISVMLVLAMVLSTLFTFKPTSIVSASGSAEHIFADTVTGTSAYNNTQHELGQIFNVNVDGQITKIRLYAVSAESGNHTAQIWRNSDNTCIGGPYTIPASIFTGTNGWVSYTLPVPLNIVAGVDYTVSVTTGTDTGYHWGDGGLKPDAGSNGSHISWPANSGRFTDTMGSRPTSIPAGGESYLRDIEFEPATTVTVNNSNTSLISYSTGWQTFTDASLICGDGHNNNTAGAYCEFTFNGNSIKWIGATNTNLGSADVYIDGVYQTTVSQNGALVYQVTNYQKTWGTSGTHTIKIVASSVGGTIVDAFVYDTVPAVPHGSITVNNSNTSLISYSTGWQTFTDASLICGDGHNNNTAGAYCQFTFNGNSIKWIGAINTTLGSADVYIDGVYQTTVSQNGALVYQATNYQKTWSTNGTHTIKIVASSVGSTVVDAFIYDVIIPSSAPRWNLNTDDTNVTVSVYNNIPFIEMVKNPTQNWNWAENPITAPLIDKVNGVTPNWVYQDATVDTSSGTKLTLRFTSSSPNLEFKSIWWARPGVGPVEYSGTIENKTGGNVTYNDLDVVSADMNIKADSVVTLRRFDKVVYGGSDPYANAPVRSDIIGTNANITSVTNNVQQTVSDIPCQVFDVNSTHGLYIGYVWSFGKFSEKTGPDPLSINHKAYLWDSGSVTEANGKIFNVPDMFIGTYKGDLDDGGNKLKKWFWNYKVPQTLRSNTNEPLVEYCVKATEAQLLTYFSTYPMSTWGAEMAKMDIGWMLPPGADSQWWNYMDYTVNWSTDPTGWPNGATMADIAHNNNQKLSLYMCNTYQNCDLATQSGRDLEKSALLYRFDNWHYDYWRSDFDLEGTTQDYLRHEGLLEVLDYMISNRSGFRYEHCSGGGTLKDFSTLQRITFMTTEDSSTAEYHRKAMYSNLYMINPVQLKADVAIDSSLGDVNNPAWVKYVLRTGFMGANMATSVSGTFTDVMAAQVQIHWPLYKTKQRPILRGADVYHILPVCDGVNWDGVEYFNTSINKGSVLLFKPSATAGDSKTIYFKGLEPASTYSITFQDRTNLNCSMTGAQLMNDGINVIGMTGAYASEIIWIN